MSDVAKAAPQFISRRLLHIVFASTSGHMEDVVEALIDSLKSITPGWEIEVTMAEKTQPQDLLGGDILLLALSTWNRLTSFMRNTYWNGLYPFIDYATGGSIGGMIEASEANVAAAGNKTIVIPGQSLPGQASHVSSKAELASFRDMLVAVRENVAKLKRQGRSPDETVAVKPTEAFGEKWGQFIITPAWFTKLAY